MLMIAVVIVTVVLVLGALVLDGGLALSEKDRVQSATDAAVLVAAKSLADHDSLGATTSKACTYWRANGFDKNAAPGTCPSLTVNSPPTQGPHAGNSGYVEVIGETSSTTGFFDLFSEIDAFEPSARSVAGYTSGGPGYGVFAYVTNPPTSCQPPKVSFPAHNVELGSAGGGTPLTINGNLRSNGSIWAGNVVVNGITTFGCQIGPSPGICVAVCNAAVQDTNRAAYPLPLATSDFPCNNPPPGVVVRANVTGNLTVDGAYFTAPNSYVLKSGLYCATGNITVQSAAVSGSVTFVSGGFVNPGGGCRDAPVRGCTNLTAYYKNVLFFTSYAGTSGGGFIAINLTGGGTSGRTNQWTGVWAAPNGGIQLGSGLNIFNGGFEGNAIKFTATNNTINANGALGGGGVTTTLVE
jgi:hypothetical protein